MAAERRLALFVVVVAALFVIAAAVSLALHSPAGVSHQARQAPRETAPVVLRYEVGKQPTRPARRQSEASRDGPAREDLAVGPRPGARTGTTTERIEMRARAFVAALLRREAEHGIARARRSIRATATPRLANFVLAEPPRVPLGTPTPAAGRIASVETVRGGRSRALAQVTVTRDRRASVLLVELIRSEGRWRAAALR
jgi:hypothetical protein